MLCFSPSSLGVCLPVLWVTPSELRDPCTHRHWNQDSGSKGLNPHLCLQTFLAPGFSGEVLQSPLSPGEVGRRATWESRGGKFSLTSTLIWVGVELQPREMGDTEQHQQSPLFPLREGKLELQVATAPWLRLMAGEHPTRCTRSDFDVPQPEGMGEAACLFSKLFQDLYTRKHFK